MINNKSICVVIPAYKTKNSILNVISSLPDFIDKIIVVDDNCPYKTGDYLNNFNIEKVSISYNKKNEGVGGATIKGLYLARDFKFDIIIKIDSDGQMAPEYILPLIEPLLYSNFDYAKGNRFYFSRELNSMPKWRLFGNSILSFFVKFSSGYWNISDPTNGFIALSKNMLQLIDFNSINKGYFFEINLLLEANLKNLVLCEVSMPSNYGDEKSSLKLYKIVIDFPYLLLKSLFKRILYKYFIYDFNICSLYLLTGFPLFIFGVTFAIFNWIKYNNLQTFTPTGTISISLLSIIMGFQLLLQAITYDVLIYSHKNK